MTSHSKLDIAASQLECAVALYVSNRDKVSAITLAGAADVIFSQLLLDKNSENFTDVMILSEFEKTGVLLKRSQAGSNINDVLAINILKHMDPGDSDNVEIDVELSALGAIAKAVCNYIDLGGEKSNAVLAFRAWSTIPANREHLIRLGVSPEVI